MTSKKSPQKSAEYSAAMRALSRLAEQQGLELSTEQRKIFWSGVVYGVKRAKGRRPQRTQSAGTASSVAKASRESVGTAPLLDQTTEPDITQGGMFQL